MSIFDIIGPVMVGPSSSHTAGVVRLGKYIRMLLGEEPRRMRIILHGSLAATGEGHGTHLALLAGLLEMDPDNSKISGAKKIATEKGWEYSFLSGDLGDVHPNSIQIEIFTKKESLVVSGSSVGGGKIRVWRINNFEVDLNGELPNIILFYLDHYGIAASVTGLIASYEINIAGMRIYRISKWGEALMVIELDESINPDLLNKLTCMSSIQKVCYIPSLL